MKTHRFASHGSEESRHLSNLDHSAEGVLLAAVAFLALLSNFNQGAWAAIAWPVLLFVPGLLLLHDLSSAPMVGLAGDLA